MENSLKGLILAAGTIITCLVISLGFFIAKEAKTSAANGAGQISKLNAEFIESDKIIYDGTQISGSELMNVMQKFKNESLAIIVQTGKTTVSYHYNYDEATGALNPSNSKYDTGTTAAADKYINPTARFAGTVLRDQNGSIMAIKFVQS